MAFNSFSSSSRTTNSLQLLTRKFVQLFSTTSDKTIDLNTAAYQLNVSKRRIYDITNILEGLDLIVKTHVNNVKWVGSEVEVFNDTEEVEINEIDAAETEKELEELYEEINKLSSSDRNISNAFITPDDLKDAKIFHDKLVFLVKTNENTRLEYPKIVEGDKTQLSISADGESIDVLHIQAQLE